MTRQSSEPGGERPHAGSRVPPEERCSTGSSQFARDSGDHPGSRDADAIRAVIDEALAAKERTRKKVILFGYSGHGLLDLGAYDEYLHGRLLDA